MLKLTISSIDQHDGRDIKVNYFIVLRKHQFP